MSNVAWKHMFIFHREPLTSLGSTIDTQLICQLE